MSKYQILYIDEQEEQREEVTDKLSDESFELKAIHPFVSEQEMINFILSEKFDAIIVDYGLSRNDSSIKYTGGDIINKVNELKEDFPAFILTQDIDQQGDEVDEHVKSTIILMKKDLNDDLPLLKRKIKKFIKLYKKNSDELSKEFFDLVKKRADQANELTDKELERLNFLDEKIELRLHGKRKFPNLLKDSKNLQQLNNILKEADEFLQKNLNK